MAVALPAVATARATDAAVVVAGEATSDRETPAPPTSSARVPPTAYAEAIAGPDFPPSKLWELVFYSALLRYRKRAKRKGVVSSAVISNTDVVR